MLHISSAAIAEKNKIAATGAWLILLEINAPGQSPVYLVYNTEDIIWNGALYKAFAFEIDDINQDGQGGLPTFALRISNVTHALESYVDASNGGKDNTLTLRVVHSDHLNLTTPELEETFDNLGCKVTSQWITYQLGAENPMRQRSPKDRYLKDHCRYKGFKGSLCGYAGTASSCDRTFATCLALGNVARFGGQPGIDGGVYV